MTSTAFVFPGQGSQSVGMGRDLATSSPAAAAVWAAADAALGEPISSLAWDGPADRLDLTENAQPALLAASIAILEALRERWAAAGVEEPKPAFAAGHSMGQYSAFVAAGVLSLNDGVRLVRRRGELMQASGQGRDGAMAALIGLDDAKLPELLRAAAEHGTFVVANRNAPDRSSSRASGRRSKPGPRSRKRSAPSARSSCRSASRPTPRSWPRPPRGCATRSPASPSPIPTTTLLANADARPITTGEEARAELVDHLTAGVDWIAAVERMTAAGVATFVEVGPGKVLSGLIKRIAPDAEIVSADDPATHDRLIDPAGVPA